MFFKRNAEKRSSHSEVARKISNRDDIKSRMAKIEEVNLSLVEMSKQTQEATISVYDKLNQLSNIPKQSLRSISAKLNEGLLLINYKGEIVHLNRAGSKIFHLNESEILGKTLGEVIGCANTVTGGTEKPILRSEFFGDLSKKIYTKLTSPTMEIRTKYMICNECLKEELPFCFESELENILGVSVICGTRQISNLTVTFSVIDNEPDKISDLTYLFLFSITA